ncbi:hypothetical protein B0H13DRAFT_2281021 [Mycena leptocephala]|nr:hypothetical protein B0H13DRAFT_2281021 [Mycena leptocephala]
MVGRPADEYWWFKLAVKLSLPARAMTAGSWHLTGRAQTLAMALARHCTIPFVPLSAWESPAFKFKPNEKFFPSLFHYLLALVSLRTGAEEPGEPKAESTSTSCGLYLVSHLQHNEFVLRATLNPVPMQNWLHVEKSSAKRETRANFCGSDRRVITERKPRKADRFLTPTKEQRNACNAWPTPWQVSVLCPSNAMNPRSWHLPAVSRETELQLYHFYPVIVEIRASLATSRKSKQTRNLMQENVVSTTIKDWNETKNVRGGKEKQQDKKAKEKERKNKKKKNGNVIPEEQRRSRVSGMRNSRIPWRRATKDSGVYRCLCIGIDRSDLIMRRSVAEEGTMSAASDLYLQIQTKRITDDHEVAERSGEKIVLSPK